YLAWKATEHMESKPKYHRAVLLALGAISLFVGLNGIYSAAKGGSPVWDLVLLSIPAFSAWTYLRSASRTKVPPK
ncbi:MAG TPA: hypothetical protein VFO86_15605, partial [Terriglobia bacterium]|nr:hypothetical protein [Terriglobia bacterium]